MAVRKTTRPDRATARRATDRSASEVRMRRLSAIIGGVLICATLAWFGWLVARQHNPGLAAINFPFPGLQGQPTAQSTVDPLLAAGITLTTPTQGQSALLSEQQARLLADQMEPQAAAHASTVSARYILFSYKGSTATTASSHDVPAWFIHYINVAGPGSDTAADPHATNTSHDCYLFLDANSGQELLALWA
jgi:hypothetical protein